jgi:glycosyltransferase involved in cell wall biosynthesis
MPIIEAFACGTPVVTSNTSSMPEIAGNAALIVDPRKPFEIAAALSKLVSSSALRKTLILKGRVRAGLFSWEKAARQTLEIINKAGKDE